MLGMIKLYLVVELQFLSSGKFPFLPGPLWDRVVVPVRFLSIVQIDVWKLLVLDKYTWNHIIECKLFVLKIVTWSYSCLQRIIIVSWNHIITWSTWHYMIMCKLLELDRNTWDENCMQINYYY